MSFLTSTGGNMIWSVLVLVCSMVVGHEVSEENSVTMVFGGDISFNGILEYLVNKDHCTYEESLEKLKPYFEDIDYVVANLESVVYKESNDPTSAKIYGVHGAQNQPSTSKDVHSIKDLSALKALQDVGINCVSVANSHIGDFFAAGTNTTYQLQQHKIKYFGLSRGNNRTQQKPLILKKNGVKIGILGYCATKGCMKEAKRNNVGAALLNVTTAIAQAQKLREDGCHAVIMFMNWGVKYKSVISKKSILTIKKLLKEVKIDLIVGTHPHVVHAHWIFNQTLIASSLGNLISPPYMTAAMNFDQPYMNNTNKTWLPSYEKLWHKQMTIMDDPSRYGKLLKVTIDEHGIILENSTYLKTRISSTNKHCMVVDKDILDEDETETWRTVCNIYDEQCAGTKECNYIECDCKDPLPIDLTKYKPHKKSSDSNPNSRQSGSNPNSNSPDTYPNSNTNPNPWG